MSTASLTVSTPWSINHEEDKRFRLILLQTLLVSVLLGVITPQVRLPQPESELEKVLIPRRVQLMAELPQLPVAPMTEPLSEPVSESVSEPVSEPMPATVPAPATDAVTSNLTPLPPTELEQVPTPRPSKTPRQRAASTGVLAMSAALKSLQGGVPKMVGSASGHSAETDYEALPHGSTLRSGVTQGSGGIEGGVAHQSVLGEAGLPDRVGSFPGSGQGSRQAATGAGHGRSPSQSSVTGRSEEQIQEILDRNKGAMYTLYNRALRDKPGLQGKLVLSITIAPGGDVVRCTILSTELNSDKLEQQLVELVTSIDFGKAPGATVVTTKLPIDFFPR